MNEFRPTKAPLSFPKLLLSPDDQISIAGVKYFRAQQTDEGYILRRVDSREAAKEFSHAALWHASRAHDWEHMPGEFNPQNVRVKQATGVDALHQLAEAEAPKVFMRWQYITRVKQYVTAGKTNRTKEQLEAALLQIENDIFNCARTQKIIDRNIQRRKGKAGGKNLAHGTAKKLRTGTDLHHVERPTVRNLFRWERKLAEGGFVPWALRDNARKCGGGRRLCVKQSELVIKYGSKYATLDRPTYAQLHQEMDDETEAYNETLEPEQRITCPSIDSLKRYVAGLSKFAVCVGRFGEEEARRRFIWTGQGPDVVRPGQRVEIDHHEIDLMTILKRQGLWDDLNPEQQIRVQRMQLCVALDVATNCVLGACLSETPSSADTIRVLRMAVSDKSDLAENAGAESGWPQCVKPDTVATDGGPACIEQNFVFAIHDLKACHEVAPGGLPWLRGTLERFFGTLETRFISGFSGRTFGSPAKVFNYKSEELAHLTTDELAQLLILWIVDVYHNTPSDGLGGETPAGAWKRLTETVGMRPVPDRKTMRAVFGLKLERELSTEGLKVAGIHYSSEKLGRLFLNRGEVEVDIRFDPGDIGAIAFRVGNEWLDARCIEPGFDGTSLAEWSQTVHDLRRSFAADNKLTAPIVRRAMRTIRAAAKASRVRENIATKEYSADDIQRLEDGVFLGFSMPKSPSAEADGSGDLLDGGFATGTALLSPPTRQEYTIESDDAPDSDDSDDFSFEG